MVYIYVYAMEYSSVQKKEWNNALCNSMDEPRDYHTKWSKSDRERQHHKWYYMTKWYKWTYLQDRNRLTDIENKYGYQRE